MCSIPESIESRQTSSSPQLRQRADSRTHSWRRIAPLFTAAMALVASAAGCQWQAPRPTEPPNPPIAVDEAMAYRQWELSSARWVDSSMQGWPTRFPYTYETNTGRRQYAPYFLDTAAFVYQVFVCHSRTSGRRRSRPRRTRPPSTSRRTHRDRAVHARERRVRARPRQPGRRGCCMRPITVRARPPEIPPSHPARPPRVNRVRVRLRVPGNPGRRRLARVTRPVLRVRVPRRPMAARARRVFRADGPSRVRERRRARVAPIRRSPGSGSGAGGAGAGAAGGK